MLQKFDDRNRDVLVNVSGNLMHRDDAGVSPFDSSVQGGDAVWEGLRVYDGRIFKLIEHLDRLRSSAQALAFAQIPAHDEIIGEIRRTLEANSMHDGVHIRLTLTRGVKITSGMDPRLNQSGPTLIVLAEWKSPVYEREGLSLVTSSVRRFPPDCLDPKIHHSNLVQSILAKIEANTAGADDALMLDTRGFVAETNATHVFIVEGSRAASPTGMGGAGGGAGAGGGSGGGDGAGAARDAAPVLRTPRTVACPEGITRATILEICAAEGIDAREEDLSLTQIYRADEMFCTGTMGELAAITTVDGRTIGNAMAGPMTERLSKLYAERTAADGYVVTGESSPS